MTINPYSKNPPELVPSFVCYADILGFSQLSKAALDSGKGNEFLYQLRNALNKAYERVRKNSKGWDDKPHFQLKIFTDNIVVGYPIKDLDHSYGEYELGHIFQTFSEFQLTLAMEGFLVRGGIAFGYHYMDDDIVFGDALLEAVAQDKAGGPPRISLSESARELLQRHLGFYGRMGYPPQLEDLIQDPDDTIYLNYLNEAFMAFPEGGIFFDILEGHKNTIENGLLKYKSNPDVRAKYEWVARYHNYVCGDFLKRHPIPTSEHTDELYAAAVDEAQKIKNYLINIESLAATPSRLNIERIFPS